MNHRPIEMRPYPARIIHERFCCNRRSAATTGLRPAGSPLGPSPYCWGLAPFFLAPVPGLGAGQAPPQRAEPVPWAPRAGVATRLSDFATNRHELCGLAASVLFIVGALTIPCGAQTPPPAPTPPPVQNQAVQPPQATPSVGVSGQANVGPSSVPTPGVGSTTSSSFGKRFGSVGQGLPGMPGGPPIKGSLGAQDPSSQYMRPQVIPPLLCDPAVNIPC
jgi:hypothetical protein